MAGSPVPNLLIRQGLTYGPLTVQRLIRAVPSSRYDLRLDPERFTPRELVAHLADFETIYLHRFQLLAAQDGAEIEAVDIDARVQELSYLTSDPIEQSDLFLSRRRATHNFLSGLSTDEFSHVTHHKVLGDITLESYAEFLLFHDLFHIEELSEFLT